MTDRSPPGDATRFYPPRFKLLMYTLGSGLLTLIGFVTSRADYTLLSVLGWCFLVGFGLGTVLMIARTLRPGATLEISDTGILERTTLFPVGVVRWDEIVVIKKREIGSGLGSERLLEVVLADPAGFRSRPRSLARRALDVYRRLVKQPDVYIAGSMVSAPIQAVIDEIKRRRPELHVTELPPRPRVIRRPGSEPFRPPRW
ncbi:MAG TPA: STM3941 family protein [Gemmatimonadales bacterium]